MTKTSPNLFGRALADHFHGEAKGPFLVCDETGSYPLDLGVFFAAQPTDLELKALAHAHGRILDVGCGAGRVLRYLQSHGHDAIGFDIDPVAIQLCAERGITGAIVESYHHIERFAPVDTVLWMNRTLCTAGTISDIKSMLERSRKICSPGGILICDSYEVLPERANRGEGIRQDELHFRYGDEAGEPFTRTFLSSGVMEKMLTETGWCRIERLRVNDMYVIVAENWSDQNVSPPPPAG